MRKERDETMPDLIVIILCSIGPYLLHLLICLWESMLFCWCFVDISKEGTAKSNSNSNDKKSSVTECM